MDTFALPVVGIQTIVSKLGYAVIADGASGISAATATARAEFARDADAWLESARPVLARIDALLVREGLPTL